MMKLNEADNINQSPMMQPLSIGSDESLLEHINDASQFDSIPFLPTNHYDLTNKDGHAFTFMDSDEQLHVDTLEQFCKKLKCSDNDKFKVISIFGNTGDGKSYTMNHCFFNGKPVFKISCEQNSCTVGVYAALQSELGVLCLDTEGLLGTTTKNNRRMRMLLKILAISDIVVYRTRSERLHSDMFEFLGTASKAFTLHFSQALKRMGNASPMGPAVIVFHETRFTKPLESSVAQSAEDKLRESFANLNYETNAFSSLRYIGIQTATDKVTSFTKIIDALQTEIINNTVRSPRQPHVILKALKLLNQKFDSDITEKAINPFPEQYFTCPVYCESCNRRCQRSMGHMSDGEPHTNLHACNYQHQYENKVFLCKACLACGKEIVVNVSTQTQCDNSWYGLAKYAWKGAVIECPECGEIYRARQYWYGNKSPEETVVRPQIVHVWKADFAARGAVHSAQIVVDGVSYISEAITNISASSAKAISGWLANKVAPSYWKPNHEIILCYACKVNFDNTGLQRHHCRGCGEGFCLVCSQNRIPVPARGWIDPVRVCNDCFQQLQQNSDVIPGKFLFMNALDLSVNDIGPQPINNEADILARKYGETIYNTISTVATAALEYPKEIIKDSARPAYWVPDAESPACFLCQSLFGTTEKLAIVQQTSKATGPTTPRPSISPPVGSNNTTDITLRGSYHNTNGLHILSDCRRHHCRRCGQAVCSSCSKTRMAVPERGWQTDVRVCDDCVSRPILTTQFAADMKATLADAINGDVDDEQQSTESVGSKTKE